MGREIYSKLLIKNNLVDVDLDELKRQMATNPSTHKVLTTPAYELPVEYTYLIGETFPNWEDCTLLELIIISQRSLPYKSCFFSKTGSEITGWCAYTIDIDEGGKYVSNLKMFSFDIFRPNVVLLRDLKSLIDTLLEDYYKISWIAVKSNPANKIYEKVIENYKGKSFDLDDRIIRYVIQNKEE